ncbi:hypothetical protein [Ferrimonas sp. SCSIO 43195]|uniref:hypothetical protein n=1 Tax=Ferrimonas sp. SCSIO 43195 TaxID=2822844 RepID=UPI002075A37E|nr:hypothetical protein [Ferrimonas sp. SCSIO 43195]
MIARGVTLALTALLPTALQASPIPGLTPETPWTVDGYLSYMATTTLPDDHNSLLDHLLHHRLNVEHRFSDQLRIKVGMRNRVLAGDSNELPGFNDTVGNDNGYWDLSGNWIDNSSVIATTSLDRLYLDWHNDRWQLQGGRFRINWGMTTVWNPNDLFNSYSIYDVDYPERPGSDAVQLSRKLGFASEWNLVYNPDDEASLDSYAGRYLSNAGGWDWQLLLAKSRRDRVVGAGLAGDVGGAGVRAELSWLDPIDSQWQGQPQSATSVSSLEGDFNFASQRNWSLKGALLHLSNPLAIDSGSDYLSQPLTVRSLSFTEWTGYLESGVDLSPLWRLTLSASYYQDHSYFLGASSSYSLAENWTLQAIVQRFDGRGDALFANTPATLLYGLIRWNF